MLMTQESFTEVKVNQRDLRNGVNSIEDCLLEVREWMDANFLNTNNEKTELVLFGSRQQLGNVTLDGLCVLSLLGRKMLQRTLEYSGIPR